RIDLNCPAFQRVAVAQAALHATGPGPHNTGLDLGLRAAPMSRFSYVNGRFVRHAVASVHIEDRGYQFADGVYEVIALAGGCFVDLALHLTRLERSLGELRIARPMSDRALTMVLSNLAKR